MAFTETWPTTTDSDSDMAVTGFGEPVRLERDASTMGNVRAEGYGCT